MAEKVTVHAVKELYGIIREHDVKDYCELIELIYSEYPKYEYALSSTDVAMLMDLYINSRSNVARKEINSLIGILEVTLEERTKFAEQVDEFYVNATQFLTDCEQFVDGVYELTDNFDNVEDLREALEQSRKDVNAALSNFLKAIHSNETEEE